MNFLKNRLLLRNSIKALLKNYLIQLILFLINVFIVVSINIIQGNLSYISHNIFSLIILLVSLFLSTKKQDIIEKYEINTLAFTSIQNEINYLFNELQIFLYFKIIFNVYSFRNSTQATFIAIGRNILVYSYIFILLYFSVKIFFLLIFSMKNSKNYNISKCHRILSFLILWFVTYFVLEILGDLNSSEFFFTIVLYQFGMWYLSDDRFFLIDKENNRKNENYPVYRFILTSILVSISASKFIIENEFSPIYRPLEKLFKSYGTESKAVMNTTITGIVFIILIIWLLIYIKISKKSNISSR